MFYYKASRIQLYRALQNVRSLGSILRPLHAETGVFSDHLSFLRALSWPRGVTKQKTAQERDIEAIKRVRGGKEGKGNEDKDEEEEEEEKSEEAPCATNCRAAVRSHALACPHTLALPFLVMLRFEVPSSPTRDSGAGCDLTLCPSIPVPKGTTKRNETKQRSTKRNKVTWRNETESNEPKRNRHTSNQPTRNETKRTPSALI